MSTKRLVNVSRTWLFTIVIVMAAATAAMAVDTSWQHDPATPGDWFDTANWTAGVPGEGKKAVIDNGGTAIISGGLPVSRGFQLGKDRLGSLVMSGGTALFSAGEAFVGYNKKGEFSQTGGIAQFGDLYVAHGNASSSIYRLSGASQAIAKWEFIGDVGPGYFIQSGGVNTTNYLGVRVGRYECSSGTLRVNRWMDLRGELDFAGGASEVILGDSSFADLSRGMILNSSQASFSAGANGLVIVPVGFDPTTAFKHYSNGGKTHTDGETLNIWSGETLSFLGEFHDHVNVSGNLIHASTYESIDLCGGITISDGGLVDLGTSPTNFGRGRLSVNDSISGMTGGQMTTVSQSIGCDGRGDFTHSGGKNSTQFLTLGAYRATDVGTYTLSDTGSLYVNYETIGCNGRGEFYQMGGTNTVNVRLKIADPVGGTTNSSGLYVLTGGRLAVGSKTTVGVNGPGDFQQDGGTHTVPKLYVGFGGSGTYALDGGVLSANQVYIGCGNIGLFNQVGGGVNVTGTLFLGYYSSGHGEFTASAGTTSIKEMCVGHSGSGKLNIAGPAPNITISSKLRLGAKGSISAAPGATIHMTGSVFENESTDSSALGGLKNLRLIFEGGTADLDPFEVAGEDKGGNWEAFHDNFTLGTLQLGGADVGQVQLVDNFDNQPYWEGVEALYVRNLRISAGSQLDLNGKNLYCLDYANLGGVVTGGVVTEVPPIQSINATYLDSGFVPTGGAYSIGELTVSDAADVVVESSAGQTTYEDCLVSMATSLFDDNSTGGLAGGMFRDGQLVIKDSADADMLTGDMIELELHEVIDGAGLLAGQGVFEVTGGSLEEAFLLPLGKIVQITFEIDPADIDDFSVAFTGVSNITLTPVPEPAALSLLAVGAAAILRLKRKRSG